MIQRDADVIIIGGGPAGSLAAYELAGHGIQVLVIEKSVFPRYKVCGGGLTHKVLAEVPFDITSVLETTIHRIRFSCRFKDVFTRTSPDPMMYCTMRPDMDKFLLDQAINRGAKVRMGEKVTSVRSGPEFAEVSTSSRMLRSLLVIGADGASGTASISSGLRKHIEPGLAWEAELKTDESIQAPARDTVYLDWGTFPGGYAWLFPKKDHISVGVGGPARISGRMLPYYNGFIRSLEPEIRIRETISLKAWPIPVRTKKARFHSGRILLAGDAGGLSDPLTGEGIWYAINSGKMAASACISYLQGKEQALAGYSDQVNEELMAELIEARKIRSIFNSIPVRVHTWVKESDRVWRAFAKVLRGERNYRDVKKRFGRLQFLWYPAIGLASIVSWFREWWFRMKKNQGS